MIEVVYRSPSDRLPASRQYRVTSFCVWWPRMKLHELYDRRRRAQTNEERTELDRLIAARIQWIGSGQGDAG